MDWIISADGQSARAETLNRVYIVRPFPAQAGMWEVVIQDTLHDVLKIHRRGDLITCLIAAEDQTGTWWKRKGFNHRDLLTVPVNPDWERALSEGMPVYYPDPTTPPSLGRVAYMAYQKDWKPLWFEEGVSQPKAWTDMDDEDRLRWETIAAAVKASY